jgi:hypothetical protein
MVTISHIYTVTCTRHVPPLNPSNSMIIDKETHFNLCKKYNQVLQLTMHERI